MYRCLQTFWHCKAKFVAWHFKFPFGWSQVVSTCLKSFSQGFKTEWGNKEKILAVFPKYVGELFYIYIRTRAFGEKWETNIPRLMKKSTELLFHSVNTWRNLNITAGSELFVNEGRKKFKKCVYFFCTPGLSSGVCRVSISIYLQELFVQSLKQGHLAF